MIPILEQPVQHLLALLESSSTRQLIAIAGMPGAGKSTLATQLATQVNTLRAPDTLVALGMDGFHYSKASLRQMPNPEEAFARRGAPWTFDAAALRARLGMVRAAVGQDQVTWPGFQHELGDPIEDAEVVPTHTRIVIVEGLYLLHQSDGWETISHCFDQRWYLDTPMDIAMERLALRHMQAWGVSREAAEQRIATSDGLNAALVAQSAVFANWRIVGRITQQAEEIGCHIILAESIPILAHDHQKSGRAH